MRTRRTRRTRWLRRRWVVAGLVTAVAAGTVCGGVAGASPAAVEEQQRCAVPTGDPGSASPQAEDLDPGAVRDAVSYASTHLRATVQIFRNNCRVATGPLDAVTERVPWNVWSSTKSVVSILTGIAVDRHRLRLDDPIGRYLPAGWGDAAHRAITVRQLLTETAGLRESIVSEAATLGTDPDVVREALAQPLTHRPGTHFEYSQRDPDLLAGVVARAVGMDLQDFAQQALFTPLGIPRTGYFWLRDRAGNTYGYANLFIAPAQFAKLGLLVQNGGQWNGRQIVSSGYVRTAAQPSPANPCYGLLFWTNAGQRCTGANIPAAQTVEHRAIPSAPPDAFAMVGAFHQNNFVIPSLNMTVSWTGFLGDTAPNLSVLLSAEPGDLYDTFFRILLRGLRDRQLPDPGPYQAPPLDLDVNPLNYADPRVLLSDLAPAPDCTVLVCDGTVPLRGLAQNAAAVAGSAFGLLGIGALGPLGTGLVDPAQR